MASVQEIRTLITKAEKVGKGDDPRVKMLREHVAAKRRYRETTCRASGAKRMVCLAEDYGLSAEEGRWVTVCESHGFSVHHDTKAQAVASASDTGWCDVCAGREEADEAHRDL